MSRSLVQVALCVAVLGAGLMGMATLSAFWEPPPQKDTVEQRLQVEVIEVQPRTVPVTIAGFGTARARDIVPITPEVSGVVTEAHPNLEVGEVIPAGELLFRIDQRNYTAALDQANAQAAGARQKVQMLEEQFRIDRERLGTSERSLELSLAELERVRALYEESEVGTLSGVEKTEMSANQMRDSRDQLRQAVKLYPIRIQEARSSLAAAEAQLDLTNANVERTEVRAPFDARITMVKVEEGQFVAPGAPVLTMADDSLIELSVPLDSRDVRQWLRFESQKLAEDKGWFGELEEVPCKITWTETEEGAEWSGYVHRVEQFDVASRTVTVAVRVEPGKAGGEAGRLPLVDGMFCAVEIPGREMQDVYRLPQWAVDFEGNTYVAVDERLAKRKVRVIRNEGDYAYVSEGLEPGEQVIVTRLMNPLPNTLLDIKPVEDGDVPSDDLEPA